jgi:hypothetical protein
MEQSYEDQIRELKSQLAVTTENCKSGSAQGRNYASFVPNPRGQQQAAYRASVAPTDDCRVQDCSENSVES